LEGLVVVDVESMVRPVVEGAGLELFDVEYDRAGGRRVLRVTVDRDGALDLETIAAVSDAIARRLDLEGFGDGRYELEVSSPGIEHPLRTPAHFARAVGSTVKIKTATPVDGTRVHVGTLRVADTDGVSIVVDGDNRRVSMADITAARTVADWSAELKGSRA
jgi:ribosome maturation factor RimP